MTPTDQLRQVLIRAEELARERGSAEISTVDVLCAIVGAVECLALQALLAAGVDVDRLREDAPKLLTPVKP